MTTYVLAGGCFWCLDAVFRRLKGIESSLCGYAGGSSQDATYYKVASGITAHAESVQVSFDESVISPQTLLDIFFLIHDPTSLNKQGADEGTQYASKLLYADDKQRTIFEAAVARAQAYYDKPIVTVIEKLDEFYVAEPEHQDYFDNNPQNPYCPVVISPKIAKARKTYSAWFRQDI